MGMGELLRFIEKEEENVLFERVIETKKLSRVRNKDQSFTLNENMKDGCLVTVTTDYFPTRIGMLNGSPENGLVPIVYINEKTFSNCLVPIESLKPLKKEVMKNAFIQNHRQSPYIIIETYLRSFAEHNIKFNSPEQALSVLKTLILHGA